MIPVAMMIAFFASLVLPVVAVVAMVTYVRRMRASDRGGSGAPSNEALLDSLDQVHIRLDALGERLDRMEAIERARREGGSLAPESDDDAAGAEPR